MSRSWNPRRLLRLNARSTKLISLFLCALIFSIPVISIYIGYAIGTYLSPPPDYLPDRLVVVDTSKLNYSWYNTHNITLPIAGGLGNHMFQYAALYGIGKANGLNPLVYDSTNNVICDMFTNLKSKMITTKFPVKNSEYASFKEMRPTSFDGRSFSLNFMKNIELHGFYQSWRYFDHIRADIRRQFAFTEEIQSKVNTFLAETLKNAMNMVEYKNPDYAFTEFPLQFIGVHIRRGDYLYRYNKEKGYTVADESYIERSMIYFTKKYKNVIFVVSTDDMEWSKETVKSQSSVVVFSDFADMGADLCLMSKCNHSIITVGTFGWWGAWLAGGETTYYRDFPKRFSQIAYFFNPSDYYIPQWIGL